MRFAAVVLGLGPVEVAAGCVPATGSGSTSAPTASQPQPPTLGAGGADATAR